MSQDDARVVAFLVDGRVEQGLFFDREAAGVMAFANDGTVKPLVPLSLLAEAEERRDHWHDYGVRRVEEIAALQSRLDAVGRLADKWAEIDRRQGKPEVHSAAAQLRAALGGESPGNDEELK